MTGFIVVCISMVLVAVLLFAWPLLKKQIALTTSQRWINLVLITLVISVVSGGAYTVLIRKHNGWQPDNAKEMTEWLNKGRDSLEKKRAAEAIQAFDHAYDLSHGLNMEALNGLTASLIMSRDASSIERASVMAERALQLQPRNVDALWLGGMAALHQNRLTTARDRFRSMLSLDLPPQAKATLEREINDLDQQLGEAPSYKLAADVPGARSIAVNVKLDPKLQDKIKSPLTLFVLVRDPAQGGPPLAVQRHMSNELPLQVELTKANAMMPTRTIESADTVEVVARLSASGTPTQQSGDIYGSVQYSFTKQGQQGTVDIEINQQVP